MRVRIAGRQNGLIEQYRVMSWFVWILTKNPHLQIENKHKDFA